MNALEQFLRQELEARKAAQLYRQRRVLDGAQQPLRREAGRQLLSFCSNDYLGLANDARVIAAFREGLERFGAGSGASHLVCGHSLPHHELEEELAAFTGRDRALVFSSGYMANVGVLCTLLQRGAEVFEDRLNHASLLDGGRFSGARFHRYTHGDAAALENQLAAAGGEKRLVVSDGVFSMDGDVAPLAGLQDVARRHGAWLMIDDAHGFGVLGRNGGGLVEQLREQGTPVDQDSLQVLVGTFGKAFGTTGAFVAGSEVLIESLVQLCRPYIYTTALPPAAAEATRCSLKLVQEEHWRREQLATLVQRFRQGCAELALPLTDSATPIQALLLGDAESALRASAALEAQGLLVTAIRPPTVPVGTARLRITFSATHQESDVDRLLDALAALKLRAPAGAGAA